ncbi:MULTISPECIES: hydroxyethylthiazole kinase [Legionella]|uniref:Hydroxyethylthiazole kinase n=1 Tax=Legionella steelei TaxID=947033 RepID=A0A0W0ZIK6_9GAMM|nr:MULTISPECIES: hydroxyethylthiazole kinase [Legionella]KTD68848.1 hydroxyethylthiazole kinase [Legionella steelei]MBN9227744.1 hydroxyethylthiazole kinase [Legionella steelei]OJW14573.1 MAG: hydroxyethylthiazole kinase [Legionella sp. 39-23]
MLAQIQSTVSLLKKQKPLILCLTNYVTMDFMANSLLAIGAAPLMSESREEIEELVHLSQAIYVNIGTLNDPFMERALFAAQIANSIGKPLILDPVGAGASTLRTSSAMKLLPYAQIIRGNASEIISLAGSNGMTKGVESADSVTTAIQSAHLLAQSQTTIVVSGPKDFITNGVQNKILPFGSSFMPLITGMGCTMTAVLSAFIACHSDYFQAALQATAYFGLCGQLAHEQAKAPASFKQVFIDNLFHPDWSLMSQTIERVSQDAV